VSKVLNFIEQNELSYWFGLLLSWMATSWSSYQPFYDKGLADRQGISAKKYISLD
jgi:hypothetical protein